MPNNRNQVLLLMLWGIFLLPAGLATAGQELLVSAAASLTNVMWELGREFERANPGVKVTFNFGASGSLLQQMRNGAPVDIFASASRKEMDRAGALGLLAAASRRDFTANRLVLAAPAGDAAKLHTLADLTDPAIKRIGLGSPASVPAGEYAKVVLTGAGLWEQLADKFIFADSVRQVLDYLSRGEVHAGLVYRSDALLKRDTVRVIAELPVTDGITYPAARLQESKNPGGADLFLDFLLSPKAQMLLARQGFSAPQR